MRLLLLVGVSAAGLFAAYVLALGLIAWVEAVLVTLPWISLQ